MVNRTALAALLLALSSPSWAAGDAALQQARGLAGGNALATYDGGCTGGSCGAPAPVCEGESCRINRASAGALQTGGLVVAKDNGPRAAMSAEVPAPALGEDKDGAKDKPGFFSKLFSGKGLMYGLGGAAAGAGIGWMVGGPIGAVIGGLIGAIGGFFLSKMLAK
ncbi:MAG: hypothetical protein PHS14_19550 [Elusimicrobia bacterium]|nr:hypothetical protein [Elusimicrobiota bacterium]